MAAAFDSLGACYDCSNSDATLNGKQAGRAAATVVAIVETSAGTTAVIIGVSSMATTGGASLLAAPVTGGTSLLVGGVAIPVEAAVAGAGAVSVWHGANTLAYIKGNPVNSGSDLSKSWASHSGQTKIIKGYKVRIDWESPGLNGNVHVTVNGKKIYIFDPSDLSELPKGLQKDTWIQQQVRDCYTQMKNFENTASW